MTPAARSVALAVLCMLAGPAAARAQDATREEMAHEFIFQFPGIAKQEIYSRTMTWIMNNLRARKVLVETDDPETGTIVANGVTTMTAEGDSVSSGLAFRMSVDVREGKERVRFLNIETSRTPEDGWDTIPTDGTWHRGAQKKFEKMARTLSDFVRMKF